MLQPKKVNTQGQSSPALQARDEKSLQELDDVVIASSVLSKSVSVVPAHTASSAAPGMAVNKVKREVVVIENRDQLNKLVEADFPLSVTVRNARTYYVLRILISPSLTSVWDKNTRASEVEPDVSDIIGSIISNGTNNTPAFGQFDPVTKEVKVIAGSRRRFATLTANVLLTMDLYYGEMSMKDMQVIMHVENIRKDPDPFLKCRSLKELIEPEDGEPSFQDQSQLASFLGNSRVHTNHQIIVGRLPKKLVDKIVDRGEITQERAHKFAQSYFQLERTDTRMFASFSASVDKMEKYRFAEIAKLMASCIEASSLVDKRKKKTPTKLLGINEVGQGVRVLSVSGENGNTKAIEIPEVSEEKFNELLKLVMGALGNK